MVMAVNRHQTIDKETGKTRLGTYYYKFDHNGVTYQRTIKEARTKSQAEEAERHARQEIFDWIAER